MKAIKPILQTLSKLLLQPIFLLVLLIVVSGAGVYLYVQNQNISGQLSGNGAQNPNAISEEEVVKLVEKVGEITELPEDELPTVATVTNLEAVRDQEFFKNAQNDDRVLVYTQARRAILYRPSTHKIIEIAPLNIGTEGGGEFPPIPDLSEEGEEAEVEGTSDADPIVEVVEEEPAASRLRLAIYGQPSQEGSTLIASSEIASDLPNLDFEVVTRQDAIGTYENLLVVVMNEEYRSDADAIAGALGASVGDLPQIEITPFADVLVILGSNYASD